jgi:GTP-binding protein
LLISAEFVTSAADAGRFPREPLAEVAFVGRSNVGKSSLINALIRRPLARTSAAPGRTRLAIFYRVRRGSLPALFFVDLPGYGYAPGGSAAACTFNRLTEAYFSRAASREHQPGAYGPPRPISVLLLVDSRHPGLESDLDAWDWLRMRQLPRAVVATKVDKLTRAERARHGREFAALFDRPVPMVSARTGEGLDELWKTIASLTSQTAA